MTDLAYFYEKTLEAMREIVADKIAGGVKQERALNEVLLNSLLPVQLKQKLRKEFKEKEVK